MARLTDLERGQLLEAVSRKPSAVRRPAPLAAADRARYLAFVSELGSLFRPPRRGPCVGRHWKL